jgi:hypothetical protein
VKTLFFGIEGTKPGYEFTFDNAELQLNGTTMFEKMSSLYFHIVQGFYHTDNAILSWNLNKTPHQPNYTLLYMYNFCLNATSYRPTGTCNFSRLDNAKLILNNVVSTYLTNSVTTQVTQGVVYAVNYNVLKIQNGLGGILFGN